MLFSALAQFEKRKEADILILPFWEKQKHPKCAGLVEKLEKSLEIPLDLKDFKAKEGEVLLFYPSKEKEPRCLLLGLGTEEKLSVDALRRAYGAAVKACCKKRITKCNMVIPNIVELRNITAEECLKGICEGILSANYKWDQKTKVEEATTLLKAVTLIGINPKFESLLRKHEQVSEGVCLARDLINGSADIVTPQYLSEAARKISERFPKIKNTVFDKKKLEKEKMGLLLAVGRGSPHQPLLIIMQYRGHPASKDHTVLVGKGVTYDTGGLNLKPSSSMETMRDDMSGAATVIGALATIAALDLKVNVTGVIPTAENAIDGLSFKTGDIYSSYCGKTVEIKDTDAEGRLILADALSYAARNLAPTRMIDFATLTGSMVVALGEGMSGVFSNNDALSKKLLDAGERSSELLWKMPLFQPYKELLSSDIADLKNVGGRYGGAILASLFLEEFVEGKPWAHIDIAGTAFNAKEKHYLPKNGVGFGIRLLIEFFEKLDKH